MKYDANDAKRLYKELDFLHEHVMNVHIEPTYWVIRAMGAEVNVMGADINSPWTWAFCEDVVLDWRKNNPEYIWV